MIVRDNINMNYSQKFQKNVLMNAPIIGIKMYIKINYVLMIVPKLQIMIHSNIYKINNVLNSVAMIILFHLVILQYVIINVHFK